MTARDTDGAAPEGTARRCAQWRLAEAYAAGAWDGVRAAADAGASAYGNDILDRLLEMPETPGLVEPIEWLAHHHTARGDRLDVIGGDEEVAGTVVRVRRRRRRAHRAHRHRPPSGAHRRVCGGLASAHCGRGRRAARLLAAVAEPLGDAWKTPDCTVRGEAPDGATLEVRPHSAVLRKLSWVRVRTTARGRRWELDTFRLRVWRLRTGAVETMRLSDTEMQRLAPGSGSVEPDETFDGWVAGEGDLRLIALRITHYEARIVGVDGAPGETLLFDDGALALEHGAWPWAPEPDDAPAPLTVTAADAQG